MYLMNVFIGSTMWEDIDIPLIIPVSLLKYKVSDFLKPIIYSYSTNLLYFVSENHL